LLDNIKRGVLKKDRWLRQVLRLGMIVLSVTAIQMVYVFVMLIVG
jgi:hypothetical protein